jgi:isocitrate dehydrogenase kinase/phosphatase
MAKLKKAELEKVQKNNQKQFEIKAKLADMVIAKQSYDLRKEELLNLWNESVAEQQEIQNSLKESYGEVTIDIQSGEIMEPAPANVEQDDNKGDS